MDNTTISILRLANQQLLDNSFKTPKNIVSWMGAMQAQDYNMAKWAIGIRLNGFTEKMVEDAFNKGEILRTHVLRPTWHFIAPEDIRWMLELTASKIKSSTKSRDLHLEITESLYTQSNLILEKALEGNNHLTRDELAVIYEKNNIQVNSSRMVHFMMRAELDRVICSGALQGKKHTYALMDERVPKMQPLHKDEMLAKLARRYFTSHGPATLQDFVWWSGLSVTDARHGLEQVKTEFISEKTDSKIYWMSQPIRKMMPDSDLIHLLPAFDEYIIAYTDRKAVISSENHSKAISSNGIFRPIIIKNGQVIGIWKKSASKTKQVLPDYFEHPDKSIKDLIEKASKLFTDFLAIK